MIQPLKKRFKQKLEKRILKEIKDMLPEKRIEFLENCADHILGLDSSSDFEVDLGNLNYPKNEITLNQTVKEELENHISSIVGYMSAEERISYLENYANYILRLENQIENRLEVRTPQLDNYFLSVQPFSGVSISLNNVSLD